MKEPQASPKVSVIVLCWNNRDLLDECFKSVYAQTHTNWEIIMVDNGSSDDSVAFTRQHHPRVTLVETGENLGFAIGNNRGMARAFADPACRYIVLLNTDAVIAPDWMEKLVAFAEKHPKLASAQSPTYDYYDHDVLDSCGILIDRQALATQIGYRQTNIKLETKRVFGVNAAAALYSRAFLEAQPFGDDVLDHDLWMYLEDVDLAARAVVMGWESWLVNESAAYHMGSASSSKLPGAFSLYMTYRNNALVLIKNLPWRIIWRCFPGLMAAEMHRLKGLWREGNYGLIKAIVKGRLNSIPRIPIFLRKRREFKKYWALGEEELWKIMELPTLPKLEPKDRPYGTESIALVVLSRNNRPTIGECLTKLTKQAYPHMQVIVVDNNSTDGTVAFVKEQFPDVTLLAQKHNLGLPNGFNIGITKSLQDRPDYFGLIQGSTVVADDWIEVMVKTMRDYPEAFAIGSKTTVETAGAAEATVNQGYSYHPVRGVGPATVKGTKVQEVLGVSDLASFYRTEHLKETGMMDGDFFDGLEDVDFCLRARLAGYASYIQPQATAQAVVGARRPRYAWYHEQKNLGFMYLKNLPFKLFHKYFWPAVGSYVATWGTALRRGYAWQQLKATIKYTVRLPRMLRYRRHINMRRRERSASLDRTLQKLASQRQA